MANCTYEAQQRWDEELNKNYKQLQSRLDKEQKDALKNVQRSWIKFRDEEFEHINSLYGSIKGSMYINVAAADRREVVKKRALELKEYYDMILFANGEKDDSKKEEPFYSELKELNSKFTYKGKPVHPGLIQEFSGWLSDSWMPTTISVDIAAKHRNEYFEDDVKVKENGSVWLSKEGERGFFYYKWLGKLSNGLHVLEAGDSGGGSGIFMDIYFVRFETSEGMSPEGDPYDRLLMTVVRSHSLGDRDDGKIEVIPNKNEVILGVSKMREQKIVLRF